MAKKWKPPIPKDIISVDVGRYYWSNKVDDLGGRVFFSVALPWDDQIYAHLFDAAGHWGPAPYALIPVRQVFEVKELGNWPQMVIKHQKSIMAVSNASQNLSSDGSCTDSGLMLLRAALNLEQKEHNFLRFTEALSTKALLEERALDQRIYEKKRLEFLAQYPEWEKEERFLKEELQSALVKKKLAELQ